MWLLLIFYLSTTVLAQHCEENKAVYTWLDEAGFWLVGYNEFPCKENHFFSSFCENSGWGNEEATVMCRELGYSYGVGRYVRGKPFYHGYNRIECQGTEQALEECEIGEAINQTCHYSSVVSRCSYVPQVYVDPISLNITVGYSVGYYRTVSEQQQNIQLCFEINGLLAEPQHIHVGTTHTTGSGHPPAIADYDYIPSNFTLTFEPSNVTKSQHCVQIEIIDDSLAEDWEVFTVLLSTNSSGVNLTRHKFDVFIQSSDGACTNGSVTVNMATDGDDSSLQLVEICSSEGVWSPVCDNNWTIQDAIVICRELGYRGVTEPPVHAVLDSEGSVQSGGVAYECQGNESRLLDCMVALDIPCYYALVKCFSETDSEYEGLSPSHTSTPAMVSPTASPTSTISPSTTSSSDRGSKGSPDSSGHLIASVVASVAVVVLLAVIIIIVVVALIVRFKKGNSKLIHSRKSKRPLPPLPLSLSSASVAKDSDEKPTITKGLTNPTYRPFAVQPTPTAGTSEHNFGNPFYTTVAVPESKEPDDGGPGGIDDSASACFETKFNGN